MKKMEKLPAKTGWIWVKEGFALFHKQPAEISTLFLGYMFLMLLLNFIPVLGQILPLVLIPYLPCLSCKLAAISSRAKGCFRTCC